MWRSAIFKIEYFKIQTKDLFIIISHMFLSVFNTYTCYSYCFQYIILICRQLFINCINIKECITIKYIWEQMSGYAKYELKISGILHSNKIIIFERVAKIIWKTTENINLKNEQCNKWWKIKLFPKYFALVVGTWKNKIFGGWIF